MCLLEDIYRHYGGLSCGELSEAMLRAGEQALQEGEYDRAIEFSRRAEEDMSTRDRAFDLKARALLRSGREEALLEEASRALEEFPENVNACNYQALAYLKQGLKRDAESCYDRALEIEPSNRAALLGKTELLIREKEYDRAGDLSERLLREGHRDEYVNMQAARISYGQRKYKTALELYDKVLELNPSNKRAQQAKKNSLKMARKSKKNNQKELGVFLFENKLYAEAQKVFEGIVDSGCADSQVYGYLGRTLWKRGDTDGAVENLSRSLELDKMNEESTLALGEVLMERKEEEKAVDCYRHAIEILPSDREPYLRLGKYYFAKSDLSRADGYFERILEIDPEDAESYVYRGRIAMEKFPIGGNPMLFFDRAIEIDPDYGLPHYYRGKFQIMVGRKRNYALESFNKAAFLASIHDDRKLLEKCRVAIADLVAEKSADN